MKPSNVLPRLLAGALCGVIFSSHGLTAADTSKSPPPAKIMAPVKEADLANLVLTPEAELRLGITTAPAEQRRLPRTRLFGGDFILPAGAAGSTNLPRQSIFTILPSLAPAELVRMAQSQIEADGQIEQASVQLEAAKVALGRAEQLLRDKAGLARSVDEARAQVSLAEAALRTAQARRELLGPPVLEANNPKMLWLRVPVYVGDLQRINPTAEASVGNLDGSPESMRIPARPVTAPPSANAASATVDLFYELPNPDGTLRLGQRAGVTLALKDNEESLVVPFSALVHDVQGGAWVYEKSAPQSYTRKRVRLLRVASGFAVLASGVKPGSQIVTTGVAELFGTEFGAGK